ncbi:MAG: DUF3794 domain-containing protein [Firmicutes bacterium]|jgi:hypothetical protein|nr:DUF3794 domain-containing protein [Bacillota bacterium]
MSYATHRCCSDTTHRSCSEMTLTLPMPAIKIKEIRAHVDTVTTHVISGKVIVQGTLQKQVFFVGEDNIVHHFPEAARFSALIEIPGVEPGPEVVVQAHPRIFNIIATLSPDGTQIIQKVIIDVDVTVTRFVQEALAEDPEGPSVLAEEVIGEDTGQVLESGTVTLVAPAVKVTEIRVNPEITQVTVKEDKVVVQGNLLKQIFFIDLDQVGRHQAVVVPFAIMIDIPGALPGMNVQAFATVADVNFTLDPTGLSVFQEVVLDVFVKVTETVQVSLELGDFTIKIEQVAATASTQIMEEVTVVLAQPAIKIKDIDLVVQDARGRTIADKVIIQGVFVKDVYYINEDDVEVLESFTIPFSTSIPVPGITSGLNVFVLAQALPVVFDPLQTGTEITEKDLADIEVIITETVKIDVKREVGGTLFKVQQVIGEGTAQVCAEEITVPVLPITIEFERIRVGEAVEAEKQLLVENSICLPFIAKKIKSVESTVQNVTFEIVGEQVLVEGEVKKDIFVVGLDNIVHHIQEIVPFSGFVDVPGIVEGATVTVDVVVESLVQNLICGGSKIQQLIVLLVTVTSAEERIVQVVVNVTGPGVFQTKTRVLVDVVDDGIPEPVPLDVVTDLTGPNVDTVTKETLLLIVIVNGTVGPVPVSVVTNATFKI